MTIKLEAWGGGFQALEKVAERLRNAYTENLFEGGERRTRVHEIIPDKKAFESARCAALDMVERIVGDPGQRPGQDPRGFDTPEAAADAIHSLQHCLRSKPLLRIPEYNFDDVPDPVSYLIYRAISAIPIHSQRSQFVSELSDAANDLAKSAQAQGVEGIEIPVAPSVKKVRRR